MNPSAGPKASPPDHLLVQCARVHPRLQLIPEFRPWLQISLKTSSLLSKHKITPYTTLWYCFALGAPLCVLLDLLGTPSSSHAHEDSNCDNMKLLEREKLVKIFIDRVRLLEVQGRLPHGEVFRVEDLFNGTHLGFAKVLRTLERVLGALQATYPGLYVLPAGSAIIRTNHLEELIDSERAHVDLLGKMTESTEVLIEAYKLEDMIMACLAMYIDRLLQYHDHILLHLDKALASPHLQEDWSNIFALDNDSLRETALGAQRSYCVHYLDVLSFLKDQLLHAPAAATIHIQLLLDHLSEPLHRISDHRRLLQSILDFTMPADRTLYDSICLSLLRTSEMADETDEIGLQLRTMKSVGSLQSRIQSLAEIGTDLEQLGLLVLDDLLLADATSGLQHSVFLYESMLLCCQDSVSDDSQLRSFSPCYPIAKWEFGPAMSRNQSLNILLAVPTSLFKTVRRVSAGALEIDWIDHDTIHTHSFLALFVGQCDQWYLSLQRLVTQAQSTPCLDLSHLLRDDSHKAVLLENEGFEGRRTAHPRPWSLIGRKGPRSESSSMIHQEHYEYGLPQSPNVLPSLSYGLHNGVLRSPSPSIHSIKTVFSQRSDKFGIHDQLPPTPPPNSIPRTSQSRTSSFLLDLTGKIVRDGKYPCAIGGFADVWKGTWPRDSEDGCKVAIKVLRSPSDDPEVAAKMHKRLRRELNVWQRLNHENILPLLGTVSDFGHYTAFVCPWLENGSVSRYLERCGSIFSILDCLQLLCEVADGLSYLHSFAVIHGDLTGSNILINDEGKACLCDFGLSSITAEFQGTSLLTSTIGGNVRWAAPELYHVNEDDPVPAVTTHSDIYSFGSVVLEVLSGHVPYSYLLRDAQVIIELHKGVKPRRPTTPLVTDQLWSFINTCWADEPNDRPNITEVSKSMQNFLRRNRRCTS